MTLSGLGAAEDVRDLVPGLDFRRPEYRREVFLRFYDFHTAYGTHPGLVYMLLPWLVDKLGLDREAALWLAFLNGHTQNLVTSLIIFRRFPEPTASPAFWSWYEGHRETLAFDTDRRYHRKALPMAASAYIETTRGDQWGYWSRVAERGWSAAWSAARSLPTFGRLSAWSYLEYLRIVGVPIEPDGLMLDDRPGSRSHRNGLCRVLGRDDLDWHSSNPNFDGRYPPRVLGWLAVEGAELLTEARRRAAFGAHLGDVTYFTLESALCTYKSWHRPNRRYPNVYSDMLFGRLRVAQRAWPAEDLSLLWDARAEFLPPHLRLESSPHDPGMVPAKQNHYLNTGQVVMMHRDDPAFVNDLNTAIDSGALPLRDDP